MLFDGVFLFRPELNDVWDFRIFVDLDFEEAMRRGSTRDQAWMGSLEIAQLRYRLRYVPGEQIYVHDITQYRALPWPQRRGSDARSVGEHPLQPHIDQRFASRSGSVPG